MVAARRAARADPALDGPMGRTGRSRDVVDIHVGVVERSTKALVHNTDRIGRFGNVPKRPQEA